MAFYLIGLGLNIDSISAKALNILKKFKKTDKIYLENYTTNFPYNIKELEGFLKTRVMELNREEVESEDFLKQAKEKDTALLVYGSPLSATTHISLILNCKENNIPYEIIHSESIFTAVSETGLQLYKFGKTASMPKWDKQKNYKPDSFSEIIKQNHSIKAHTLLLIDIGLSVKDSLTQLEEICKKRSICINKIILCSRSGTENSKIYYEPIEKLKNKDIKLPFCIIIPSKLHFIEKEALKTLKEE